MPRFNRTGPMGFGPRTGRGMGPCGCGFYRQPQLTRKEETEMLTDEQEMLEQELKEIKSLLTELKVKK